VRSSRIRSRADIETYIGHFNAHDYDRQIAYYADDVAFRVGSLELTSPAAIKAFYADFHEHCAEDMRLLACAIDGNTVAAAVQTRFEPFRDYVRHGLEFRVGHGFTIISLLFYALSEGKIRRINMARYGGSAEDFDAFRPA
jgi:ketosteroid isomerase-like protein